jgi:hypothetical protein
VEVVKKKEKKKGFDRRTTGLGTFNDSHRSELRKRGVLQEKRPLRTASSS